MYALLLVDEADPVYSTLNVFDSSPLWDWMRQELTFRSASDVTVDLPAGFTLEGGGTSCTVTAGSPADDLMQAAAEALGDSTTVEVELPDGDDDEDEEDEEDVDDLADAWRAAARAVCAARGIPADRIAEGLWY